MVLFFVFGDDVNLGALSVASQILRDERVYTR